MRRYLLVCLLLAFGCQIAACDRPALTGVDRDKIDTSIDPEQTPLTSADPMVIAVSNGTLTLVPKAKYRLAGRVVSRETYSEGWESEVSPIDLALVWGKLADPQFDRYVSFSQSGRWYFFKTKPGSPLDGSYISTHSGNNHIIPANENLKRTARSVKRGDQVVLEGFLVNLKGTYRGREVSWNTSLSRSDTGSGSCEILYLRRVRVGPHVYE